MNHKYRDLVGAMHVPTEWSERMLSAAGQEIPEEKQSASGLFGRRRCVRLCWRWCC